MAEERKKGMKEGEEKEEEGTMTVQEAGHRGGEATSKTHGHEFYQEIGHKGGEAGGHKGGEQTQAEAQKYEQMKREGKIKEEEER